MIKKLTYFPAMKAALAVAAFCLTVAACSKDSFNENGLRRSSAPSRSTGVSESLSTPVSFARRSPMRYVSMPDMFTFTSFHFLSQSTDNVSKWWPEMGSVAEWQTVGDINAPFYPTDATTAAWPMKDAKTSQHLNFYAASLDESKIHSWDEYYDYWSGMGGGSEYTKSTFEYLLIGETEEDDGMGGTYTVGQYASFEDYENGFKYGTDKGWYLSKNASNEATLTVRNPYHFIDFVAAASIDNGPSLAVPMDFSHALCRVESMTLDWIPYWHWKNERAISDQSALIITSITFNDTDEATFTFVNDGTGTFVPQNNDYTSATNWFLPPIIYSNVADPEDPYYGKWMVQDVFMSMVDNDYVQTPDGLGDGMGGGVIYCNLAGDMSEENCVEHFNFGSPFLSQCQFLSESERVCDNATYVANPHYFGHPTFFPGKHKVRIEYAIENYGQLHLDMSGVPYEDYDPFTDTYNYIYPYKKYSMEGTFILTQGTTNNLVLSMNAETNVVDVGVTATLNGWAVETGGEVNL